MSVEPVEQLIRRAEALIEVRRYDDAARELAGAVAAAPDDWYAHVLLARVYLSTGRPKDSLASASTSASLAPSEEWPHRLRALALGELDRHGEALAAAEESVRCAPELPEALYVLASAQLAAKHHEEAERTGLHLRSIAPETRLPHSVLGMVAIERKRWKEAELHILKALEIAPDSANDLNNLGVAYEGMRRKEEAIEMFHRAAALDPRFELARQNLAASVGRYAGISGFFIYLLIRVISSIGGDGSGVVGVVFFAAIIGVYLVVRRRRLRKLHPTVQTFYRDAKRRSPLVGLRRTFADDPLPHLPNWVLTFGVVALVVILVLILAALGDDDASFAASALSILVIGGLASWLALVRWGRRTSR